jgi:predicted acylesterase/phospholipase RssA
MINILAIDGGGMRGIIPAMLLAEIEDRTGQPIAHFFDLVAGTSTGGILALGLTVPKHRSAPIYSARQLVEMYEREGPHIFSRSIWHKLTAFNNLHHPKYSTSGIEEVLRQYFGDARLRDAATRVLITSYEVERSFPFFFRSAKAREREDYDFPARDVARATSAAPTYFKPMKMLTGTIADHYTLIDGGVFANNPAACALVEARTAHPEAGDFLMVSLGTGESNLSLPYDQAKNWGLARWAAPILDVVFDGVSRTVDYQLRQLLPEVPDQCKRYYRFQTTLDGHNHQIDSTGPAHIAALKTLAMGLIEEQSDDLDQLCDTLAKSRSQKE